MPFKKLRQFICPETGERCKYTGCRCHVFCLRGAAKGNLRSAKAAEEALRAYLAEGYEISPNKTAPEQGCVIDRNIRLVTPRL